MACRYDWVLTLRAMQKTEELEWCGKSPGIWTSYGGQMADWGAPEGGSCSPVGRWQVTGWAPESSGPREIYRRKQLQDLQRVRVHRITSCDWPTVKMLSKMITEDQGKSNSNSNPPPPTVFIPLEQGLTWKPCPICFGNTVLNNVPAIKADLNLW